MEVAYSPTFEVERKKYSFCFTCEYCAYFDDVFQMCLHGYPNAMHRLTLYEEEPKPRVILFCKEFDLA